MKLFDPSITPKLLTTLQGKPITTAQEWEDIRRPEIVEMFTDKVFGRLPCKPDNLRFHVEVNDPDALDGAAVLKTVTVSFDGPYGSWSFPFWMFVPQSDQPVGALLLICIGTKDDKLDITRKQKSPSWPVEEIVARGYAAVAFHYESLAPDNADCFANSVHTCFEEQRRSDSWGAIAAWAWGAMRVMDYLQTDPDINKNRVGVVGHSRGAKTALLTGMLDTRFNAVFSNNSGCMGAALTRFKGGESVAQINERFPYWFCDAFRQYDDREREMPFEQHMLLATIAPRLLYVSSATKDEWADPDAELTSVKLAGEVYRLYCMSGIRDSLYPIPDKSYGGAGIGYHRRTGPHGLLISDWMHFIDFLDARW